MISHYIKLFVFHSLCVFYTCRVLFGVVVLFVTKYSTKFWKTVDRSVPPKCLQNREFGEHKYLKANGIKFHYVEKGDQTKPLMLFIHGYPEFWYSWRFQLQEFSKDYWCVALDMRGYGDTEKPTKKSDYDLNILVDDIKGFVDELGRKKFILVAHDWGAVLAFEYVQKYMETIEKYICLDAPPVRVWIKTVFSTWDQFTKSWYVFFFQAPYLPEFIFRFFDMKTFMIIGNGSFNENFTEEDLEAYKYTFGKPDASTGPINYYRNLNVYKYMNKKHINEYAPGLYLLGENDLYISKETGPAAQRLLKNLEFKIIPGANHFAQQDAPDDVNKLMWSFLKKK